MGRILGYERSKFFDIDGNQVDPTIYKQQLYTKDDGGVLIPTCGGKVATHDLYCHRPAGYDTDHFGKGRCRHHGGNFTSETHKGNQNAFKHGAYSKLYKTQMYQHEQDYFEQSKVVNLDEITEQIKLSNVRIARLLENIMKFDTEMVTLKLTTKKDQARYNELLEWKDKTERQINIVQRNLNYQLMSKAELEKENNVDEITAQENRKKFIDSITSTNDKLFGDDSDAED